MANKTKQLIDSYRQLRQQGDDCVLATIIETFGSTYQKAGARMLITRQDELIGLLGGGCFERDLVEQARSVFDSGEAKTVCYDMRAPDDMIWGLGLGCNGAVTVLLQLLQAAEQFSPLSSIADASDSNMTGVLVTVYESSHSRFPAGYNLFLPAPTNGYLPATAFPLPTAATQTLLQQKPRLETHLIDGQTVKAFYDPLQPPLHLLVLGAGTDALPLVQFAKALGWNVTVVDHRPGYIQQQRFLQADRLLHIMPEEIGAKLPLAPFSAVVLMTHNIEYDGRYLQAIGHSDIPFIGLLGPAHRKDRLLQSLGSQAAAISDRVFGPVGLDIGAQTPEEIALAIMAGIHAELSGRSGQQLSIKIAT
ncbi:MAG: XdhC family protein [Methylobacter sp.]